VSVSSKLFPHWDFSSMKTDKDIMWTVECEPEDKRKARGIDTLNWLWKRKETEIALVAHGGSLLNMMN